MDNNKNSDIDWLNNLVANVNGTQMSLFEDDMLSQSASSITTAAGNIWPYGGVGGSSSVTTTSNNAGSYTWTTNGTGGYNLGTSISPDPWQNSAKLKVQGDAEFDGDVKIKGKSIAESLDKIEARLAILHPSEKLEEKWDELKKLGDAYRALEKDIIEKEKIWETLKK